MIATIKARSFDSSLFRSRSLDCHATLFLSYVTPLWSHKRTIGTTELQACWSFVNNKSNTITTTVTRYIFQSCSPRHARHARFVCVIGTLSSIGPEMSFTRFLLKKPSWRERQKSITSLSTGHARKMKSVWPWNPDNKPRDYVIQKAFLMGLFYFTVEVLLTAALTKPRLSSSWKLARTNSVFTHSRKRPAPVANTFSAFRGCP